MDCFTADKRKRRSEYRFHERQTVLSLAWVVFLLCPLHLNLARCMFSPPFSQPSLRHSVSDTVKAESLFDGKTLDGWAVPTFAKRGPVTVENGAILLGAGDGCTGVTWQRVFPKIGYEVNLDAMRISGSDFFCGMTFPVNQDCCTLIVGGWGGSVVGLSSIDGLDASENFTGTQKSFENNRWYHVRLRVTSKTITAWIDDENVVAMDLEGRKLSIRYEVRMSTPFGIVSWKTTAAIKNIVITVF